MATLKTCFKCGLAKPREEFYAHPKMGDGLLGKCKVCARKDVRANRASRSEYYRTYDMHRYHHKPGRKEAAIASFKRAARAHPERKRVSDAVGKALREGRLQEQPCWVCGERAEAHHPDYSQPLQVVWLCVMHHRQTHAMLLRVDEEAA